MMRFALLLLLAVTPALAATPEQAIEQQLQVCLERPANASTAGQITCIDKAAKAWDGELNARYRTLMNTLAEPAREPLRGAQRAWIGSRDADLKVIGAVYETVQGTMYALMSANDVMELTSTRVRRLQPYQPGQTVPDPKAPVVSPDDISNGIAVPHRGSDAQQKAACAGAGRAACLDGLAVAYKADLADLEALLAKTLPQGSRVTAAASNAAWRKQVAAEAVLIEAALQDPADRAAARLTQLTDRVDLLQHLTTMVGVN